MSFSLLFHDVCILSYQEKPTMATMLFLSYLFQVFWSLQVHGYALPQSVTSSVSTPTDHLIIHNVIRFEQKHQCENLAVRANDQVLVTTTAPSASVYQIDPLEILAPILVASFPDAAATSGIVESPYEPDVFYVATGNLTFNGTFVTPPTAFAIWELNMKSFLAYQNDTIAHPPEKRLLTFMPDSASINSLTALQIANATHLLAADSVNAVIWSITLSDEPAVTVFLNSSTLAPSIPAEQGGGLGVNGVKIGNNNTIFYTNSAKSTFHSVPAYASDQILHPGTPTLVANVSTPDDFVLDNAGNAFICQQVGQDTVSFYNKSSGSVTPLVPSGSLVGPTAVRWGRSVSDRTSLYVTTNGGLGMSPAEQGVSRLDVGDIAQISHGQ